MENYEINITEPAENDLRDIAKHIFNQLNAPTTAQNMIQMIKAAIAKLKTMPLAHPPVRDDRLAALGYRVLFVKNYIVFYVINEKEKAIDVDRILYGRRDWRNIL
ncbi:MAG: type II toxin-antitoxin system RelE/ParE family toxin [Oscillospiraceae bacterium]|nr:type II toxin-antitoxin system RelE/ParE family toxin [Oscillospiraceae bacterium]